MGAGIETGESDSGWIGDVGANARRPGLFLIAHGHIESAVRDSLKSLGWPT
jgi:hypothetical protein